MYRALIVEDEPLMRQYLMEKLTDIHPGWQAAASAADGTEALSMMHNELFDLVITDIRMAGMDGLTLAKYLSANHPDTFVIILSGYDEFDYARTAVRLNVCDYLLKPLNDDELNMALEKVSQKLKEARRRRLTDSCFPSFFKEAMEGIPYESLAEYAGLLNDASGHFGLIVLHPNLLVAAKRKQKDMTFLCQELFSLAFDFFSGLAAMDKRGSTVIMLPVRDVLLTATVCIGGCSQLSLTFEKKTGVSLLGGFSKPHASLDQVKPAYEEAAEALMLAEAGDGPFLSGDLLYAQRTRLSLLRSLNDSWKRVLSDPIRQHINEMHMIATTVLSRPINKESYLMLGAFLIERLTNNGNERLKAAEKLLANIPEIIDSPDACVNAYVSLFVRAKEQGEQEGNGLSPLAQKVREYLHVHFRESISLAAVADAFNVTPAYLSALFHKEVGESYSKYLVRIRMEFAAVKLSSDPSVKMYDVARQAGFVSSKHFLHVFRTFYGKTPGEYREQCNRRA